MLFIVIHQAYELWFKEVLHELDRLQALLAGADLPRAGHAYFWELPEDFNTLSLDFIARVHNRRGV